MTTRRRSVRMFNVRPESYSLANRPSRFSSGWVTEGGGAPTPVSDDDVITAALRILAQRLIRTNPITSPTAMRAYLAVRFAGLEHEVFTCVFLDKRYRVIACEELFRGTITGSMVHPREVVKRALMHNAGALIVAHNHPTGDAEPSEPDQIIAQLLKDSLALVDILLLDSLVIGGATIVSMAERGMLKPSLRGGARWRLPYG